MTAESPDGRSESPPHTDRGGGDGDRPTSTSHRETTESDVPDRLSSSYEIIESKNDGLARVGATHNLSAFSAVSSSSDGDPDNAIIASSEYDNVSFPSSSSAVASCPKTHSDPSNLDVDRPSFVGPARPSSPLGSKYLRDGSSSRSSTARDRFAGKPHHAYFASSEEESEAELDDKDSHSSRDASNRDHKYNNYGRVVVPGGGTNNIGGIPRGSIAGRASLSSHHLHAHSSPISSRTRTTITPGHHRNATTKTLMRGAAGGRVSAVGGLSCPGGQTEGGGGHDRGDGLASKVSSKRNAAFDVATVPPVVAAATRVGGGDGGDPSPDFRGSYDASPSSSSNYPLRKMRTGRKRLHHRPRGLPLFQDPRSCSWTSTHDANAPSEDRYSSLVNVLLRPPKTSPNGGGSDSIANATSHANNLSSRGRRSNDDPDHDEENSLIRLSLWSVIDGHGGGCVATYAAEVLLPHIAASVARALGSEIVDRGVCNVNGQLRDANALDLDGLIRSSDRTRIVGVRQREAGIDIVNPNSIHYRSPYEEHEIEGGIGASEDEEGTTRDRCMPRGIGAGIRIESESEAESEAPVSIARSLLPGSPIWKHGNSASSGNMSLKTNRSPTTQVAPVGTHSPSEVASLTRAVIESFLAVDEGWINSIDPVTTHQTSCVSNGRWNAGACALVVFIVQRLDWRRFSDVEREPHHRESGVSGFDDTSHNKDAARRRKLDRGKSVGSFSTLSSTSSITTEANITDSLLVETEDDDVSGFYDKRRRWRTIDHDIDYPQHQEAECECHYYYPHDAMLYTAHVGDCRAVMLGSAPPRTIKVPPDGDSSLSLDHADISEDDSCSESIADEISSSEHDSDSSGDMLEDDDHFIATGDTGLGTHPLGFVRRTSKRQRRNEKSFIEQPFVPLPPLNRQDSSSEESAVESDDSASTTSQEPIHLVIGRSPLAFNGLSEEEKMAETEDEDELKEIRSVRSGSPTQMDRLPSPTQLVADPVHLPPLPLSLLMRPIDLTTDHSAYNPAEVNAVLRRCHNAPKAISSASSGGIKRVAGSLAVTRALGDAYLKTPRLSFFPYKRHAPYITARPEVNCRVLTKGADRILMLATDGVWERASGDDVLRWVRNYYNSHIAGMEEQHLYDVEEEQHDAVYGDSRRLSRLANEGVILGSGDRLSTVIVGGGGNSRERSSEEDASTDPRKAASLAPTIVDAGETTSEDDTATLVHGCDDKLGDSDANSTSQTLATNITASETAAPVKTLKRKHSSITKHSDIASVDDSVSTRSTTSSRGRGVGVTKTTSRRPRRSSSTPTVADVIVRKVLNKVRKTRNISSLRMLMSLPKGRARRSKHDDITAMVVDLSGFVS